MRVCDKDITGGLQTVDNPVEGPTLPREALPCEPLLRHWRLFHLRSERAASASSLSMALAEVLGDGLHQEPLIARCVLLEFAFEFDPFARFDICLAGNEHQGLLGPIVEEV